MEIRNGENKGNQGMESRFHYPSKKKYDMFPYVMRNEKQNLMSVKDDRLGL